MTRSKRALRGRKVSKGGYVYVVNSVEIPIWVAASPRRVEAPTGLQSPSLASGDVHSVPTSPHWLQVASSHSSPFPVFAVAADGYLVRLVSLESAPASSLGGSSLAVGHAASVSSQSFQPSLTAAASGHTETLRMLVGQSQVHPTSTPAIASSEHARAPHDPYALVPSLFGPCLAYATTPLLRGPLWQDVLIAGPVLKYSARR